MGSRNEASEWSFPRSQRVAEPTASVCLLWAFGTHGASIPELSKILEDAGMDMASLLDARTRLPSSVWRRLLELHVEEVGDPAVGLRVGVGCGPGAYGMVEQLGRSAPTLRDSIRCYERYVALLEEAAELKLIEQGPHALIVYRANEPQPGAVIDFVLSYTVATMRRHVSGGVHVEELRVSRPPPDYHEAYAELLGVPARFDAPHDAVVIRRDDLAKPMSEARAPVHAALEAKVRRAFDRLVQSGSFEPRVRSCIRDQLARGSPSLERVARRLHASPTTLRRRLAEQGTSFRELLDSMRAEAALRDVLTSHLTTSEIASRLGFTHTNGFYKAFKRWTGLSPGEYRARRESR